MAGNHLGDRHRAPMIQATAAFNRQVPTSDFAQPHAQEGRGGMAHYACFIDLCTHAGKALCLYKVKRRVQSAACRAFQTAG